MNYSLKNENFVVHENLAPQTEIIKKIPENYETISVIDSLLLSISDIFRVFL